METKLGLAVSVYRRRLGETIAWCSTQKLVGCPEENVETLRRREMSRRAAELLGLAFRTDPSLYERRRWIWRLMHRSRIRRASNLRVEAEDLFAIADPGSIEPPLREQLRSEAFRSYAASLLRVTEDRTEVVAGLAENRASLLCEMNASPAGEFSGMGGGRLLVYETEDNLEDGASQYVSKGYFDEKDAPPWDTWVCYFDRHLISWVPPALLDLAQAGIAANVAECVRWVDDDFLDEPQQQ